MLGVVVRRLFVVLVGGADVTLAIHVGMSPSEENQRDESFLHTEDWSAADHDWSAATNLPYEGTTAADFADVEDPGHDWSAADFADVEDPDEEKFFTSDAIGAIGAIGATTADPGVGAKGPQGAVSRTRTSEEGQDEDGEATRTSEEGREQDEEDRGGGK